MGNTGAASCTFDDVAKMLGNGVLLSWYAVVFGREVRWRWRFSCQGVHCLEERKRMVELADLANVWRTEHGDYTYGFEEATRRCLDEYAQHLGFSVNGTIAFHNQLW